MVRLIRDVRRGDEVGVKRRAPAYFACDHVRAHPPAPRYEYIRNCHTGAAIAVCGFARCAEPGRGRAAAAAALAAAPHARDHPSHAHAMRWPMRAGAPVAANAGAATRGTSGRARDTRDTHIDHLPYFLRCSARGVGGRRRMSLSPGHQLHIWATTPHGPRVAPRATCFVHLHTSR